MAIVTNHSTFQYRVGIQSVTHRYLISLSSISHRSRIGISSLFHRYLIDIPSVSHPYLIGSSSVEHGYFIGIASVSGATICSTITQVPEFELNYKNNIRWVKKEEVCLLSILSTNTNCEIMAYRLFWFGKCSVRSVRQVDTGIIGL